MTARLGRTMDRPETHTLVLLNTADAALATQLKVRIRRPDICVIASVPGLSFMETARRIRPRVAVLDGVDERVDAAQMEIELLKELRADVRIIAISSRPSPQDAWVVERGVFFYSAAPEVAEVVRLIEAAAAARAPAVAAQVRDVAEPGEPIER